MDDHARAVELGAWLTRQRTGRSYKRPELVKEALRHLPHARISQDYLAKLEYGHRSLADASIDVREALRAGLGISAECWAEETGLGVPARSRTIHAPKKSAEMHYIAGYALAAAETPALAGMTPLALPIKSRPRSGVVVFLALPVIHYVDLHDREPSVNEKYIIHLRGEFIAARVLENPDAVMVMIPERSVQSIVEAKRAHVIGHVISAQEAGIDLSCF